MKIEIHCHVCHHWFVWRGAYFTKLCPACRERLGLTRYEQDHWPRLTPKLGLSKPPR